MNKIKIFTDRELIIKALLILLLIPVFFVLYKIYIPRINAFGCFDDCFYIVAGHFIQNGRQIYSDFFFNHQPIAAFISFLIQSYTDPVNIFELVLKHRQFVFIFGLLFNILLILRFGLISFIFVIIYEFSKFYLFGDRFLAETIIVYPLVYIFGLSLLKLSNHKLFLLDYILLAIFSWFVIFSREPYVPVVLFLFLVILFKSIKKERILSFSILLIFSVITLSVLNLKDYFFNVVNINFNIVMPLELKHQIYGGPLQMFFYNIFILLDGPWNIFKMLLVGLDVLFLLICLKLLKNRRILLFMFVVSSLFLANLKPNIPGKLFYESFHMIIWYALFIFSIVYLISKERKIIFLTSMIFISLLFMIFILSPTNFVYEKISPQEEFITNYGSVLQEGEVIKALSTPKDTLFLDGSDDLVYWQAERLSPYKYTWYTSIMPYIPLYTQARIDMFKNNPPIFYRSMEFCTNNEITENLPETIAKDYTNLFVDDTPSCIWIRKDKIKDIKSYQWEKAGQLRYYLPENEEI